MNGKSEGEEKEEPDKEEVGTSHQYCPMQS